MSSFKEEYRVPIFNLIKNCYTRTSQDLLSLGDEDSNQLSISLKKLFFAYNKKQFNQLKNLYETIYKLTWSKLLKQGGWEHICLRESFIMGQLAGITYWYTQNDYTKTLEICDQSFIMGTPKELLLPIMDELSIIISQEQQISSSSSSLSLSSITIPMILDENINFSKFPIINKDHEIKVIKCNKNNNGCGVDEFSIFKTHHLDKNTPCIIKGDAINWECINKWKDLNYFLSNHGNRIVPIELGHNKLDSKTKKITTTTTLINTDWSEKLMKLKDFIEEYMIPSSKDTDSTNTESSKVAYLAQHGLIEQLPSLLKDFKFPLFLQMTGDAKVHETEEEGISPHIWLGTGNTVTPLHFDSYDNFLTQIVGYKYVRLYPQNQSSNLYLKKDGDDGSEVKNTKTAQNNISFVDIEDPDLEKYPLLNIANQHYTEYILGPGDILFMPSGYFHYVRSLSTSLSLSFWFIKK
ncbi:hypothetical protein RB653_009531 [Dictyostelium firmibasis]|uniref:JmjC domain-containing protein n=1 Tax=Dictyostelium firmibasis TaxID=79012 RepID=A0AAN7UEH0_9MYCE